MHRPEGSSCGPGLRGGGSQKKDTADAYTNVENEETHITLECSAVVDGKDQYDIPASIVCFSQDGKIFLLSGPGALFNDKATGY